MEGSYPVQIDGVRCGTLTVTKEGLMTVFRAECKDPGVILRLSLYGEREGYLGVMEPGEKGLSLCRRLSREALRSFPEKPVWAGPAGQPVLSEQSCDAQQPYPASEPEPAVQVFSEEAALPEQPEEKESEMLWHRGAGGALTGVDDQGRRLLAVPVREGTRPAGREYELRSIEGTEYVVFVVQKGKLFPEESQAGDA